MVNPTVSQLLSWDTSGLLNLADELATLRNAVAFAREDLAGVSRGLPDAWEGLAATSAQSTLGSLTVRGGHLEASLTVVVRALRAAGDILMTAQRAVMDARAHARRYDLTVLEDGRCPRPRRVPHDAGVEEQRDYYDADAASWEIEVQAREALRVAADADQAAAAAIARAWLTGLDGTGGEAASVVPLADLAGVHVPPARTAPRDVAAWWAALTAGQRALIVRLYPEWVGNLDGIPVAVRVAANRVHIAKALADERVRLAALKKLEPNEATQAEITATKARIETYDRFLDEELERPESAPRVGHQVVLFDPEHGRYAEVIGSFETADYLCVYVPGTGTTIESMTGDRSAYLRTVEFVDAAKPDGSLAVINYLGGPMPQGYVDAVNPGYELANGPGLADFVNGVQTQTDAMITAMGHSYGGAEVGVAEAMGLRADRILHVESAGAGARIASAESYSYPATERFSMTAPGDLIVISQGLDYLNLLKMEGLVHGLDPDLLAGVTRLDTGYYVDHQPSSGLIEGRGSHSDVYTVGSTAWNNMLNVMTNRPVEPQNGASH